jgi:phytoene desaturase
VDEITLLEKGPQTRHRVHWGAGQAADFDAVVSNADVHHTYAKLYRSVPSARRTTRKLERSAWSMSLFVLYFGTDRPYDIAHHTVLFGPRYKALLQEPPKAAARSTC